MDLTIQRYEFFVKQTKKYGYKNLNIRVISIIQRTLNKISVPFIPSEFDKEKFEYAAPMDNYDNCWWKVSYLHGCNKLFFNPETKEMR